MNIPKNIEMMYEKEKIIITNHASQRLKERKIKLNSKDFDIIRNIIKDNQHEDMIKIIYKKMSIVCVPKERAILTVFMRGVPTINHKARTIYAKED